MKKCPVCNNQLPELIPEFCDTCGWVVGEDLTLQPILNMPDEEDIARYKRRLENARKIWNKRRQESESIENKPKKGSHKEKNEESIQELALKFFNSGLKQQFNNGNYIQAIIDYSIAIKMNPKYISAYNNRATCYGKLGKKDKEKEDYQMAENVKNGLKETYKNKKNGDCGKNI